MTDRRIRHSLLAAVAMLAFALSHVAAASAADAAKDEIDHLLDYVATSSCTFVRNGSEYPAGQARDHLAGKYRWAGSRISTAEEFIRYVAGGSSMSGEPYHVRCGTSDRLSGEWLTSELKRYREAPRLQRVVR
ncbi:MAG TPA: DUF5329 domain-containing protein [Casimicrobiaceae bacterium]